MPARYFEDFEPGTIIEIGSKQITEEEIIAFASQFDPQPFHIDPEKAKDSFYGGIIASGWHTASIFMRLYVDAILGDTDSLGSPGLEELKWPKPVRPGDTLFARFTVLDCIPSRSKPNIGIIKSRSEVFNQEGELVMSLQATNFVARKE